MAETREGLWMSAKERDRLKVLHEVRKRHITQKQAGVEMGLSERWVRTLLKRVGREEDKGTRYCARTRNHFRVDLFVVRGRVSGGVALPACWKCSSERRFGAIIFAESQQVNEKVRLG